METRARLARPVGVTQWLSTLALVALLASTMAAGLGAFSSAVAQEQTGVERSDEEVSRMALALQIKYMSPYCPGANLRDCTSGKAAVLREEIRQWVAEGKTEAFITEELVSRYGESILSAPRFRGFNAVVWIFPFLAGIVGLGVIFMFLQKQKSKKLAYEIPSSANGVQARTSSSAGGEDHLEQQLEAELSDRSR